jgi:gamma-glutamylcyclotransferase (GGCT)/AIG2-like uncharacterized protein YtfP
MEDSSHLFVYGTLRKDERHEMYHILARHAEFLDEAVFQGKLYLVEDFPAAVCSHDPKDKVRGEVYRLANQSLVLAQLDEYEECSSAYAPPTLFIRVKEDVLLRSGKTVSAWIYLYNRSTEGLRLIASGDYLQVSQRDTL